MLFCVRPMACAIVVIAYVGSIENKRDVLLSGLKAAEIA
jgi:hypothetical protein